MRRRGLIGASAMLQGPLKRSLRAVPWRSPQREGIGWHCPGPTIWKRSASMATVSSRWRQNTSTTPRPGAPVGWDAMWWPTPASSIGTSTQSWTQRLSENPEPETAPHLRRRLAGLVPPGPRPAAGGIGGHRSRHPHVHVASARQERPASGFDAWPTRPPSIAPMPRAPRVRSRHCPLPLAADGVDEVLGPIMCAYTEDPHWEFVCRWPNRRTAHGRYRRRAPPRLWYRQARCRVDLWRRSGRRPARHRSRRRRPTSTCGPGADLTIRHSPSKATPRWWPRSDRWLRRPPDHRPTALANTG